MEPINYAKLAGAFQGTMMSLPLTLAMKGLVSYEKLDELEKFIKNKTEELKEEYSY